jgi:hypothetical protein
MWMHERQTGSYRVLVGRPGERDNLKDIYINGMLISKWIFKKWDGWARTGLLSLRIETEGGRL